MNAAPSTNPPAGTPRGPFSRAVRVAFSFLTTLPVRAPHDWRDDDLRLAIRAYPLVGVALGLLLVVAAVLLTPLPELPRGALLAVLLLALTGALHYDGLCDMADAALAPKGRDERWRIAKDPRVGSFALAAGASLLLLKTAALASLPVDGLAVFALVVPPLLGRGIVLWVMARYPVHDASLLGRTNNVPMRETAQPLLLAVLLLAPLALAVGTTPVLAALAAAILAALAVANFLLARLGGLGGDAYGAVVETSEAAALLALAALL